MREDFSGLEDFMPVSLKIRHEDVLNSFTANKLSGEIDSFKQKHEEKFKNAYMGLDIRRSGIKIRGVPEYECKINLVTDKGLFHSTSKGVGIVKSVREALKEIGFQVDRKMAKYGEKASGRHDYPSTILEEEN